MRTKSVILALLTLGGCAGDDDAGVADATVATIDAQAAPDAAPVDGALADAAPTDAAPTDAAPTDAALPDAALPDAALPDAALPDAAPPTGEPLVLVEGATTAVGGHTDHPGSVVVTDLCPAGHAMTGMKGGLRGTYHGAVSVICRPFVVAAGSVHTVEPGLSLPFRGELKASDTSWIRECPVDQAVVGLRGRAGAIIDQLVFTCAPMSPGEGNLVQVGAATEVPLVGGVGGNPFGPLPCPAGQIAHGALIYHSGDPGFGLAMEFLDGLGLACATPSAP